MSSASSSSTPISHPLCVPSSSLPLPRRISSSSSATVFRGLERTRGVSDTYEERERKEERDREWERKIVETKWHELSDAEMESLCEGGGGMGGVIRVLSRALASSSTATLGSSDPGEVNGAERDTRSGSGGYGYTIKMKRKGSMMSLTESLHEALRDKRTSVNERVSLADSVVVQASDDLNALDGEEDEEEVVTPTIPSAIPSISLSPSPPSIHSSASTSISSSESQSDKTESQKEDRKKTWMTTLFGKRTSSLRKPPAKLFDDASSVYTTVTTISSTTTSSSSSSQSVQSTSVQFNPTHEELRGPTPSLLAITHATRIFSPSNPRSILSPDAEPLVVQLAGKLVRRAGEEGAGTRKRSTNLGIEGKDKDKGKSTESELVKAIETMDEKTEAARVLGSSVESKKTVHMHKRKSTFSIGWRDVLAVAAGSVSNATAIGDGGSTAGGGEDPKGKLKTNRYRYGKYRDYGTSTLLSSIVPVYARPPDPLSSRSNSRDTLLTDRYGFTYELCSYDILLLFRARDVGCAAPACATGVRIADREEGEDGEGTEEGMVDIVENEKTCTCIPTSAGTSFVANTALLKASTRIHACPRTMHALLDDLGAIHDARETEIRIVWDAWLSSTTSYSEAEEDTSLLHGVQPPSTLLRGGIPTAYRAQVWYECSGAAALCEPGGYDPEPSLSASSASSSPPPSTHFSYSLLEIEKDIPRTMPLNIFFGGGAGVPKLRAVLTAFSRRNPAIGYCQGLNLVTAVLLLVYAVPEEAFWVLCALVEKRLPKGWVEGRLEGSRAGVGVLDEYLDEGLGKRGNGLKGNLDDLGVDLSAITFPWFLGVWCESVPVETLFRVWDIFLCEPVMMVAVPSPLSPLSSSKAEVDDQQIEQIPDISFLTRLALALLLHRHVSLPQQTQKNEHTSTAAAYIALSGLPSRVWGVGVEGWFEAESDLKNLVTPEEVAQRWVRGWKGLFEDGDVDEDREDGI